MPGPQLTLEDLVANRTLSREIAATLRAAVSERRSFLVLAVPRFAGKSTLMRAMLANVDAACPVVVLGHDGDDVDALVAAGRGGYLVVPEVSRGAWVPGYVWGEPVRRAFSGIAGGTALATALHAPGIDEAFAILCGGNRVPDDDAAHLQLVVYLRSLGPERNPERRVVASVHEVVGVGRGRPDARILFRWDKRADRFDAVERPRRIGHG